MRSTAVGLATVGFALTVASLSLAGDTPRTTSESIALENLRFQIEAFERRLAIDPSAARQRTELGSLRTRFLGDFDELQLAHARAVSNLLKAPKSAESAQSFALVLGQIHRFSEALGWLDYAESLGADATSIQNARSVIDIAQGRAHDTITWLEFRAESAPSLATHTTLAAAYAALGWFELADDAFERALAVYRDVSPFPVAWIQFQRGVMWAERAGQAERGRSLYESALVHLPSFVTANVHLAEFERETDPKAAMQRLERILPLTSDPEPLGVLAELYFEAGDKARGSMFAAEASRRYARLLSRLPDAFADHATEFYLGVGADPKKAFALASLNVENRATERSYALLLEAAEAVKHPELCRFAIEADRLPRTGIELEEFSELFARCAPTRPE